MRWVLCVIVMAVVVGPAPAFVGAAFSPVACELTNVYLAEEGARVWRKVIQGWMTRHNNQIPESLISLADPLDGSPAYVEGKEKAIFDPWGGIYKFTAERDKFGAVIPYVWTERFVGGKTLVYGQKPPEKKD